MSARCKRFGVQNAKTQKSFQLDSTPSRHSPFELARLFSFRTPIISPPTIRATASASERRSPRPPTAKRSRRRFARRASAVNSAQLSSTPRAARFRISSFSVIATRIGRRSQLRDLRRHQRRPRRRRAVQTACAAAAAWRSMRRRRKIRATQRPSIA